MSNFLSGRQTELKVGISSFTESKTVLSIIGNANISGILTASSFSGNASSASYAPVAGVATALQNSRTFEITGDIVASAVSFDGTGNVSLAATIQPNSVALGTDTTGDYVQSISGTSNQITVTSGSGESSTPTLSVPNQFTAPQDVTVTRDLQVNRNLNVNGNITIGGTSATLFTTEFKVYDPDIVLGFRTDVNGNDVSTDNTANHGGIAIASTEGTPLIQLYDVGVGETNPASYKKFMWFKSGTFSGLGTDAWISNYAIGIGSTQVPNGVRLAAGSVQFTERDLSSVRDINASGIITATGGFNLGISSAGTPITSGPITQLNFIGVGNTFAINGTTVDVSIAGGGGASVSISTEAPADPNSGDLWYNNILGRTFIYYDEVSVGIGSTAVWVDAAPFNIPEPPSTPGKTSETFTATAGQTSFTYSYSPGYIDVFLNGIRLNSTEFVANNGTSITLIEAASSGDILDVVEYTMGIGDTGPQGSAGLTSLAGIISTTDAATYYPFFTSGVGSTVPYVNTVTNYFSFVPSSGTLSVNQLNVVGIATATDFNSASDINLKKNVKVIDDPISKVLQIKGVTFDWLETNQPSAGVIAQDVEKVLPEIVKEVEDVKTINYNGLIGLLIEVVKEQQEQINNLKSRIEKLEG